MEEKVAVGLNIPIELLRRIDAEVPRGRRTAIILSAAQEFVAAQERIQTEVDLKAGYQENWGG